MDDSHEENSLGNLVLMNQEDQKEQEIFIEEDPFDSAVKKDNAGYNRFFP
jgi:hypothetical protein